MFYQSPASTLPLGFLASAEIDKILQGGHMTACVLPSALTQSAGLQGTA